MTTLTPASLRAKLPPGVGRNVVAASAFNVVSTAAAGIAGIVIARSLGASVRGEYAAIMAWFTVTLVFGGLGQPAATTFFVARDPDRASGYLAVSRSIMIASGAVTLVVGVFAAPLFASENATLLWGYRIMSATCLAAFVGISYTFALQGSSIAWWNVTRISQPVGFLIVVTLLQVTGWLTLMTALVAFAATMLMQTAVAYRLCGHAGLTGGRPSLALARPLARYGAGQLAATIPLAVIVRLDQLALSLAVDPAALGNYAVAASLTTLTVPVAAGLGYVAFPRIAARLGSQPATSGLQRRAVAVSAGFAIVLMLPLAAFAPWLIPKVFGTEFRDAVGLVFILAPGGVFLACQQVCADLLRGYGLPFAVARAQWVGAGLMVVLLGTLMPILGPPGAAVASVASTGVSFLLLLRALNRAQHNRRETKP